MRRLKYCTADAVALVREQRKRRIALHADEYVKRER